MARPPGRRPFALNQPISLEAVPATGYVFSNWSGDVTGTTNPTSLVMDCDKTVTATFKPISKLYFPHVASQIGSPPMWETEICMINAGDQAVSGTMKTYRHNGLAASTDEAITLPAHGRWSRIVGWGAYPNPSEIGYMVFEYRVRGHHRLHEVLHDRAIQGGHPRGYRRSTPRISISRTSPRMPNGGPGSAW